MKNFTLVLCLCAAVTAAGGAYAVSAGTVSAADLSRGGVNAYVPSTNGARGKQGLANAYKTNQLNNYYMVTQPDVDTACRQKIYKCLSNYCGDMAAVPGQRSGRCQYTSESELYNYATLCLQKDTEILLPQYNSNTLHGGTNTNTAAQLCPPYIQQEVMSYLAMVGMSDQLSKSHSNLCIQRRQELEAAMTCHSVAMTYGNETSSKLRSELNDYCGPGVPGGSAEMVSRFANAGNVGANIWGWAEKMVSLEMNNKGADWQSAVDSVLASYTNRMNLACGENLQINTADHSSSNYGQPSNLQTAAALITGVAFPTNNTRKDNPYEAQDLYMEVQSLSMLDNYATAKQVVNAAMTNSALTQNAFLTSAQMDSMQTAYKRGTKVFVISDSARCYTIPVAPMTSQETSLVAQVFASCRSQ